MLVKSLTELVGNTPMLELSRFCAHVGVTGTVLAKLECFNPGSSVKDRIALSMILDAEQRGLLKEGATIIEPTSGNTGIGLAWIAASRGYKMILTMSESMSIERRKLAAQFGAEVVLTPAAAGMNGAIEKAKQLQAQIPGSFIPQQFENPANPEVHRRTTALEIWTDTDGQFDVFVAGVGTGGTITGVGEALKARLARLKVYAVEPDTSAVLSGQAPGAHRLQGLGAGFVPKNLNTSLYDGVVQISGDEAFEAARLVAKTEGLLVGISSGAALAACVKLLQKKENAGLRLVTVLPDTGERYLSTPLFD